MTEHFIENFNNVDNSQIEINKKELRKIKCAERSRNYRNRIRNEKLKHKSNKKYIIN